MKKIIIKDFIVLIFMIAILFFISLFLPNKVPIHFNSSGNADIVINKFFLLLFVVIPYSSYWQFLRKSKKLR